MNPLLWAKDTLTRQRYEIEDEINELLESQEQSPDRLSRLFEIMGEIDTELNEIEERLTNEPEDGINNPADNDQPIDNNQAVDDLQRIMTELNRVFNAGAQQNQPVNNDADQNPDEAQDQNADENQQPTNLTAEQRARMGRLFFQALLGGGGTIGGILPAIGNLFENLESALDELEEALAVDVPVPLEKKYLDQIPIVPYSKEIKSTQCSICLDEFVKDVKVRDLPCPHAYHPNCIDEWFKTSPKCPLCKADIRELLEPATKTDTVDKDQVKKDELHL